MRKSVFFRRIEKLGHWVSPIRNKLSLLAIRRRGGARPILAAVADMGSGSPTVRALLYALPNTPVTDRRYRVRASLSYVSLLLMTAGSAHRAWAQTSPQIASSPAAQSGVKRHPKDKRTRRHKAKQPLTALSLAALGKMKVTTVSKEPEEVWRTPAAVYVLTQDEIRRSGATTIPDLLRLIPGVNVAQIDSDHWAVGVRGFGSQFSQSLLVLIDGRSVYTPLFGGVYWEVQDLPLEDIDRIEVIRGPGGTIWGANAVNGVINIITKRAKDTHGKLLSMTGGNVDEAASTFQYGAGNGNGFDYRLYGMGFDDGPEFHSDGDLFDAWRTAQGGFRTDWELPGGDTVTAEGDLYDGYDGEQDAYGTFVPPGQETVEGPAKVAGGDLLGSWERKLKNGSDVQLRGYYEYSSRLEPNLGEDRGIFDLDFQYHRPLPHHQDFIWGLDAQVSPSDFIQVVPTLNFAPEHQTDQLYSGFLQDQIPIVQNRLWLTLGSKLLYDNYTGFEPEPSARLLWAPSPRNSFWAAFTQAVSTPSDLDEDLAETGFVEAVPGADVYLQIAGTGKFVSERMTGYEAGYRSLIRPKLYLDVDGFYNDYNDLYGYGPASVSVAAGPQSPYILITFPIANGVMGKTAGFEIAPDWKPNKWWEMKGSYSFLTMNLVTKPGNPNSQTAPEDEGLDPKSQIVVQSLFNLPKKFEFDPTFRYVSQLSDMAVPAYSTADARLGWRPNSHLEFSIGGGNLLQAHHLEFISDPGPAVEIRRSAYAKTTFRW